MAVPDTWQPQPAPQVPGLATQRWQAQRGDPLAVHQLTASSCLDVAVVAAEHLLDSRPHLVVLDVDSTLIEQEVIDLLADHAGCADQVAAITEQAMRGHTDFAVSLRERVALLKGLPLKQATQVGNQLRLTCGAAELVGWLQGQGHRVLLASGGFGQIVRPLAEQLGVDALVANTLGVRDGQLTGQVEGPIIDRAAKAAALRDHAARWQIPLAQTVAIGDGANDVDMLTSAGVGVAFCAKSALRQVADVQINQRNLRLVQALLSAA